MNRQYGLRKTLLSTATALLICGGWTVALGDSADTPADQPAAGEKTGGNFEEVVVTAQKRVQNINEVGLTVTALSGETLRERQVNTLADIAQLVPGLSFTLSGSNTPVYTLRGVGFYETTLGAYPDVSVYLDEAPLPFPVLTSQTAFDLERVEVLKGPQGTLFGNNATGGALNYIAAKPTNDFAAGAQLGFGRFDTFTGEGYVSGPLSDTLKARISGKIVNSGDWQHGYTNNATTGAAEVYAGRILLDWQPTDDLRFQVDINGWKDGSEPQAVQFIKYRPNFPGSPSPVSTYPTAPGDPQTADFTTSINPHSDNRLWQTVLRADYDLTDKISLTSLTSYVNYNQDMAYDGDGVTLKDFDVQSFGGQVTSFSQELRAAQNKGDFRWVVGGNVSADRANDNYILVYPDSTVHSGAGIFTSGFQSSQQMNNYAGFVNGEYDIADLTLKAGVRFTEADRRVNSCFYGLAPDAAEFAGLYQFLSTILRAQHGLSAPPLPNGQGCLTLDTTGIYGAAPTYLPGEFRGKLNENNVSFRVGVDWKPEPGLLLYGNITRGYKAGSFPSAAAATTPQLLPVTQESVLSYEIGIKSTLLDGLLQANGAAFYYDYTDKQLRSKLLDPIFGVLDALVNIPESSVRGVEMELVARPTGYVSAYVNAVYLDATIDKFVGISGEGVSGDFSGAAVPYTPRWQFAVGGDYERPITSSMAIFVGGDVNFRSGTTAIIAGSNAYAIRGYATLDLRLGVEDIDSQWRLELWGKNITNTYYWTNVASYYDTVARYAGRPAMFGGTLSYKFE